MYILYVYKLKMKKRDCPCFVPLPALSCQKKIRAQMLNRIMVMILNILKSIDNPTGAVVWSYLDNDDGMDIVLLVFGRLLRALWLPKWPGPGGIWPITPRGPIDKIPLL